MTIDEAIKQLETEKKNGTKNIVFAYWDASCFDRTDDDDWAAICDSIDHKMDWSNAHDDISETIRYAESLDTN
jgi:hypothetical protein